MNTFDQLVVMTTAIAGTLLKYVNPASINSKGLYNVAEVAFAINSFTSSRYGSDIDLLVNESLLGSGLSKYSNILKEREWDYMKVSSVPKLNKIGNDIKEEKGYRITFPSLDDTRCSIILPDLVDLKTIITAVRDELLRRKNKPSIVGFDTLSSLCTPEYVTSLLEIENNLLIELSKVNAESYQYKLNELIPIKSTYVGL